MCLYRTTRICCRIKMFFFLSLSLGFATMSGKSKLKNQVHCKRFPKLNIFKSNKFEFRIRIICRGNWPFSECIVENIVPLVPFHFLSVSLSLACVFYIRIILCCNTKSVCGTSHVHSDEQIFSFLFSYFIPSAMDLFLKRSETNVGFNANGRFYFFSTGFDSLLPHKPLKSI